MEFTYNEFNLQFEQDDDGYDIYLYKSVNLHTPLIYLNIKPLSEIDFNFDDKLQIRDIPRYLFQNGDFYQSTADKYDKINYSHISLLSVIHDILLEHKSEIPIKRLFSSSLNNYKEECFFSDDAKRFWEKQLQQKESKSASFFENDKRYYLQIKK